MVCNPYQTANQQSLLKLFDQNISYVGKSFKVKNTAIITFSKAALIL